MQQSGTLPRWLVNTGLKGSNGKLLLVDQSGSERELARRLAKGDEMAFEQIWMRHQGPVYRYAWHLSGSVAVAEEATQETFLALIETPDRFDPARGTLGGFLYGIARNCTLRRLRQDKEQPLDDGFDPADSVAIDDSLFRAETIERVRAAVTSLPMPYREAVVLCDLEDQSYEQAAGLMECAVGTVRSRLARGRQMLAEKLRKRHEEASCGRNS